MKFTELTQEQIEYLGIGNTPDEEINISASLETQLHSPVSKLRVHIWDRAGIAGSQRFIVNPWQLVHAFDLIADIASAGYLTETGPAFEAFFAVLQRVTLETDPTFATKFDQKNAQ